MLQIVCNEHIFSLVLVARGLLHHLRVVDERVVRILLRLEYFLIFHDHR